MKNISSQEVLTRIGRSLEKRGDALFLAALGGIAVYAAFLFFTLIYPPIFSPSPLPPEKRSFSAPTFDRAINRIETRDQRLEELLANIPQDPFRGEK